ncbi:YcgN family cysteine cluster protein [Mangrovicoccus sp. HB161399]|uniref:YcgN family cysteine cluster protein n=1 Tax=Mangrovicoccus sp. HB161399 TaxID=2720392 RepID=UPI0015545842|nr:YcgN family cysteine cluster protein [Mangrovicoccus sp. HB161399]
MRPNFWKTVPPEKMTREEWEALCDGCGKCCLNKLEDADTGEVAFTRVACRLLDDETCLCSKYEIRKQIVPECVVLTPGSLEEVAYWLPSTCAYRLVHLRRPLPKWHYLVSGSRDTVHEEGMSVQGWTIPEYEVDEDDWEDHIIEDL